MVGEDEESCKYIDNSSTYCRPDLRTDDKYSATKYQLMQNRNSWCLPTYVSYTDSVEWSAQSQNSQTPLVEGNRGHPDQTVIDMDGGVTRRQVLPDSEI